MAKFLPFIAAIASLAPGSIAFTALSNNGLTRANDVRLRVKLEGRDIDGVVAPTNNFVLVKVANVEDQTSGGILLTGSVR